MMLLDCKHATQLASRALDKRLPFRQRLALRLHLLMCGACTKFVRQLQLMRQALAQLGRHVEHDPSVTLSPQARERIAQAVAVQTGQIDDARRNPDQHSTD
jgi:hypothetical protein